MSDLGYIFTKDGVLVNKDTERKFDYNYERTIYETLCKIIEKYIYAVLQEELNLQKIKVPIEFDGPNGFIFCTKDFQRSKNAFLLVHGSGNVRAGQWSRRLITTKSLTVGSQIPYIKRAIAMGFPVVVLNTNQDSDEFGKPISCNKTPEDHFNYVIKKLIMHSAIENIVIVAHSY